MPKKSALALALAGVVSAQSSSVVNIFFPGADSQILIASLIASDASKTTMAVTCPSDADSGECGFVEPVTVTVGPSTFHAEESFETTSGVLDCTVTGTTAATCEETYIGPAGLIGTDIDSLTASDATLNTQMTTAAVTTTLSPSEIAFIPVTITAFAGSDSGAGAAATTSATGTKGTETDSSESSSSSSGNAAPPSESSNVAVRGNSHVLGWSAMGAGLLALTIVVF